jgi:hypothetical protein
MAVQLPTYTLNIEVLASLRYLTLSSILMMTFTTQLCTLLSLSSALAHAASYRTVGSSGCAAQMVFVPPYTNTVVFLDKCVSDRVHRKVRANEM